jgi:predicted PurR-regulated permease PerM
MAETARRTAIATLVVIGLVAVALALWKLKLLIALLFLGFTIAAAMRPTVEWLHERRVPRAVGILLHYLVLAGVVALILWLIVPRAVSQVQSAVGTLPSATKHSTGFKHQLLNGLDKRLRHLPNGAAIVHPALSASVKAFEVVIGIFFMLSTAAYWVVERDKFIEFVASTLPRPKRKTLRDTWMLIDAKLGAFVRGQLILIAFVSTVLSVLFFAIGLHYWLLVGVFGGVVEFVPVIGPLAAGIVAVGVGLTQSVHVAGEAAACVLGLRLAQDYLISPRVLGGVTGLSPLIVLISATSAGLLFGAVAVVVAVPLAVLIVTIIQVTVMGRDPAEEEHPTVLFTAKEGEG